MTETLSGWFPSSCAARTGVTASHAGIGRFSRWRIARKNSSPRKESDARPSNKIFGTGLNRLHDFRFGALRRIARQHMLPQLRARRIFRRPRRGETRRSIPFRGPYGPSLQTGSLCPVSTNRSADRAEPTCAPREDANRAATAATFPVPLRLHCASAPRRGVNGIIDATDGGSTRSESIGGYDDALGWNVLLTVDSRGPPLRRQREPPSLRMIGHVHVFPKELRRRLICRTQTGPDRRKRRFLGLRGIMP